MHPVWCLNVKFTNFWLLASTLFFLATLDPSVPIHWFPLPKKNTKQKNPILCNGTSFTHFVTATLKFGMKQGLEGQTKDQKQGDFMDNFNEK
jgi:hypothetical protein